MLVSVVIPTYNGSKYVARAVSSALSQTHQDIEVIVVDDGSVDDTVEVLEGFADAITIIRQPNQRVAAARNRGVAAAQGSFVAFLDQDDEWAPTKIERQLSEFQPGVVAVGSYLRYVNAEGRALGRSGEVADSRQEDIKAARFMPFAPSSLVVKRTAIETVGGFDEQLALRAPVDDLDLLVRVARLGRVVTVPEVLGFYRIHGSAGSVHSFFEMQMGTRYLQAKALNPQLTWAEFAVGDKRDLSTRRREYSKFYYRSAGVDVAEARFIRGIGKLLVSLLLNPGYGVRRLAGQSRGH